jgi:hypothetical protein
MLLAFGSIIVSLGILVGSDGAAVSSWTAPPSTFIAIFTAIANLLMRYACIQGVVIAWYVLSVSYYFVLSFARSSLSRPGGIVHYEKRVQP